MTLRTKGALSVRRGRDSVKLKDPLTAGRVARFAELDKELALRGEKTPWRGRILRPEEICEDPMERCGSTLGPALRDGVDFSGGTAHNGN